MSAKPPAALKGHGLVAISGFSQLPTIIPLGKKSTAFHTVTNLLLALWNCVFFLPSFLFKAEIQRYAAWVYLNPEARLHHSPIIRSLLCPHFMCPSCLTTAPMTLCCYAAVLFWENLGQLGRDVVSWDSAGHIFDAKRKKRARARKHQRIPAPSVWWRRSLPVAEMFW